MAAPSDKLADALQALETQQRHGVVAVRSQDLSRTHRERLLKNGFLQRVVKGWYIPSRPDEPSGESTAWYTSYWAFCASYLTYRFDDNWCLSPEQSVLLHAGNWRVPQQLLVHADGARNQVTSLPYDTTILEVRAKLPAKEQTETMEGLRLYTLPAALIACSAKCYTQYPTDLRTALHRIQDSSELLEPLLEGGHSTVAGRLAGAMRNIGRDATADEILVTMRAADYDVRETAPFANQPPQIIVSRETSAYVPRIRLMWQDMREIVLEHFPAPPGLPKDQYAYLKNVDEEYVYDAYHSLSIEGYRVSEELIERVRRGDWDPDNDETDRQQRDALAARGYWLAFQAVRSTMEHLLKGDPPGEATQEAHRVWYRELFSPSVTAGILSPGDLAGYRNAPVYIRHSMHTPPKAEDVRETMPVLFELLQGESEPAVRAVLGHFVFVYLHPYLDGNGRLGRFLMNAMLASGGYRWLVIRIDDRDDYMGALEHASVNQNIEPFTQFLAKRVADNEPK